jgi:hypothetical protein
MAVRARVIALIRPFFYPFPWIVIFEGEGYTLAILGGF